MLYNIAATPSVALPMSPVIFCKVKFGGEKKKGDITSGQGEAHMAKVCPRVIAREGEGEKEKENPEEEEEESGWRPSRPRKP